MTRAESFSSRCCTYQFRRATPRLTSCNSQAEEIGTLCHRRADSTERGILVPAVRRVCAMDVCRYMTGPGSGLQSGEAFSVICRGATVMERVPCVTAHQL